MTVLIVLAKLTLMIIGALAICFGVLAATLVPPMGGGGSDPVTGAICGAIGIALLAVAIFVI